LLTYTDANTESITAPTAAGWTPQTTVEEVLAMRQASIDDNHFGPWDVLFSTGWEQYLDEDYSAAKGNNTLRQRLQAISGISSIMVADYLTGTKIIMYQKSIDVIRAIVGMEVTTVQWDTIGGLQKNFKVMAIIVPNLRSDIDNKCGIVVGS